MKALKKRRVWSVVILGLLFSCAPKEPQRITVLYTNDMHAQFLPSKATWMEGEPKPLIGGMTALKYYLDRERAAVPDALILDAGDWMTGNPISDIMVEGAKGGGFIQMMNMIGYHASVLGNHEFDNGAENVEQLIKLANFDVITANLFRLDSLFAPYPYRIYSRGQLRVGVIGLILEELFGVVGKDRVSGLEVRSVARTAQIIIDEIDPKTDLIVIVTHQGWEEDSLLATVIHGADVIVGGHSHTRLEEPKVVNKVIIVQAGSHARYLGRLDLTVQEDTVSNYAGRLIPLWVEGIKVDPTMDSLVTAYQTLIDEEYGAVIGELVAPLGRSYYYGESDLGNWLTDAMREMGQADFALLNSGGIRKDLAPGPITKLDIMELLPFHNVMVRFSCTGKELLQFMETNAAAAAFKQHGILQLSGMNYTFGVASLDRVEIVRARVGGKAVDPTGIYTGVTVDFVLGHAEKYLGFVPQEQEGLGIVLSDVIINYILEHSQIGPPSEGRMKGLP